MSRAPTHRPSRGYAWSYYMSSGTLLHPSARWPQPNIPADSVRLDCRQCPPAKRIAPVRLSCYGGCRSPDGTGLQSRDEGSMDSLVSPRSEARGALRARSGLSDRELLRACTSRETGAWSRLYARYIRLVRSIPLKHGLSAEDAADVAQATFESFAQQLEKLGENCQVGAWLTTVARRNTWRVVARRRR